MRKIHQAEGRSREVKVSKKVAEQIAEELSYFDCEMDSLVRRTDPSPASPIAIILQRRRKEEFCRALQVIGLDGLHVFFNMGSRDYAFDVKEATEEEGVSK